MMFFTILAIATLLAAAIQAVVRRLDVRASARIGMAVAMIFAGVAHLLMPAPFLQHLPPWTPFAEAIIFLTGLIEIEYKRDARDGRFKLLDMNPRLWGWHSLCGRAGVDFPYLLWLLLRGEQIPETAQQDGVGWLRVSTDTPMALRELARRRLPVHQYLRSLRGPRESAIFARDDPLPGVCEFPILAYVLARRLLRRQGV